MPVMIRAADDHGLGRLRLEMKLQFPLPLGEDNSKEDKEQSGNLRVNRPHPNPLPEGGGRMILRRSLSSMDRVCRRRDHDGRAPLRPG